MRQPIQELPSTGLDRAVAAFAALAARYARAMDRNEPDLLDGLYTVDIVVEGPGFRAEGLAAARGTPAMLRDLFVRTRHVVHQQTLDLDGEDVATGETYCTASHVLREEAAGRPRILVWAIRYQDRLRREGGTWRFAHRRLIVDWTETRAIDPLRDD